MQVSTKIFNKQSVETFSDLTAQIQKKQEQVASGKELTKPSDDPVRATRVMIVEEQRAQNEQYLRNIDISSVKLSLTESASNKLRTLLRVLMSSLFRLGLRQMPVAVKFWLSR